MVRVTQQWYSIMDGWNYDIHLADGTIHKDAVDLEEHHQTMGGHWLVKVNATVHALPWELEQKEKTK